MNNSDQSLRSLFELAKQKQKAVESHPDPSALDYAETLQLAVRKYEECLDMIQRLSLFSSNETLDEIATTDIRYYALTGEATLLTTPDILPQNTTSPN